MIGAKHQCLHLSVEVGVSRYRYVTFRLLRSDELLFGTPNTVEDRRIAVLVLIDAYAQIDLAGILIFTEQGHDPENGILGKFF